MGKINCPECGNIISDTVRSCPNCGFNKISSYLLYLEKQKKPKYIDYTSFHNEDIVPKSPNIPKCPTCGSTNIKSISGTKRWLTAGLFGLASSNIGKSMECKNCGYKW